METTGLQQRDPRVPFSRAVHVFPIGSHPRRLKVKDLSRGGMFVESPQGLPCGTHVNLSLEVRGKILPLAKGEVVRQEPAAGFGLKFTDFAHARSQALVDYVVRRGGTGSRHAPPFQLPSPEVARAPERPYKPVADETLPIVRGELIPDEPRQLSEFSVDIRDLEARPRGELDTTLDRRLYKLAALLLVVVGFFGLGVAYVWSERQLSAPEPQAAFERPAPVAAVAPVVPEATEKPQPETDLAPLVDAQIAPKAVPRGTLEWESVTLLPPGGALKAMDFEMSKGRLEVQAHLLKGAKVERVFSLEKPSRLVFDIAGPVPSRTRQFDVEEVPVVEKVRLGIRPQGTRIVLDVKKPVGRVQTEGTHFTVSFK